MNAGYLLETFSFSSHEVLPEFFRFSCLVSVSMNKTPHHATETIDRLNSLSNTEHGMLTKQESCRGGVTANSKGGCKNIS
jgi:hypothetical protein